MNPPPVKDLPPHVDTPCPMSTEPLPEPLVLEPPVEPLVPIPWNIHCRQYSSMDVMFLGTWPYFLFYFSAFLYVFLTVMYL